MVQEFTPPTSVSESSAKAGPGRGDRPRGGLRKVAMPVGFGVALLVGALARFDRIAGSSLWHDESFSWSLILYPYADVIRRTAIDVHPPLYYLILKAWVGVFGDSVFAMRGLSALLGLGTLAVLGPFAASLCEAWARGPGRRGSAYDGVGLFATALFALNAFVLFHAREVRMYPLGGLLAVLSSWALWRGVRGEGRALANWSAYALTATGLLYTHNYGVFTVAAQALFAAGSLLRRGSMTDEAPPRTPNLAPAALAFLAIALAYAPWLPVLIRQRQQVAESYYTQALDAEVVCGVLEQLFLDKRESRHPLAGGTAAVLVAAVLGGLLFRPRPADAYLFLLAGLPLLAGVALSLAQGRDVLIGRCLYFSVPFFAVAVARLVARIPDRPLALAVGALLAGMSAAPWLAGRLADDEAATPGLPEAARSILLRSRPGDVAFTADSDGYMGMRYYARGLPVRLLTDREAALDHFRAAAVIPDDAVVTRRRLAETEAERAWLVTTGIRPDGRSWIPRDWSSAWSERFADSAPHRSHTFVELFLTGSARHVDLAPLARDER